MYLKMEDGNRGEATGANAAAAGGGGDDNIVLQYICGTCGQVQGVGDEIRNNLI